MYRDINRYPCCDQRPMRQPYQRRPSGMTDYGPAPFVFNIQRATVQNDNFRIAVWTGEHMQVTLMSLEPGESIGLEKHQGLDQFIRIEEGRGIVRMGDRKDYLSFQRNVKDDDAIIIPADTWHNVINTGPGPMKLYSIYTSPTHMPGTVEPTKADAEAHEH